MVRYATGFTEKEKRELSILYFWPEPTREWMVRKFTETEKTGGRGGGGGALIQTYYV